MCLLQSIILFKKNKNNLFKKWCKICLFTVLILTIYSDVAERPDLTESIFLENGTTLSHDSGYGPGGDFCCPASPTSVPAKATKTSGMIKKFFTWFN